MICLGLYAEENVVLKVEPRIKLQLIHKGLFEEMIGPKGFPSSEIMALVKETDVPQIDNEWLLNSLRVEIARKKKVLYTTDKNAISLPEDLNLIITSNNFKFMLVYARHFDYGGFPKEYLKDMRTEANRILKLKFEWDHKLETADDENKNAYRDSMLYWGGEHGKAMACVAEAQNKVKRLSTLICMESESGRVLWQKEGYTIPYLGITENDVIVPAWISDDGKRTIAVPSSVVVGFRHVIFYDAEGNREKEWRINGHNSCHGMSIDGELFYAVIREQPDDDSLTRYVTAYDKNGYQLWSTGVAGTSGRNHMGVSPSGKYAAVTVQGTFLLNNKGKIIDNYSIGVHYPAFSTDDKYLVLWAENDTTYFIKTSTGEVLWKKSLVGHACKTAAIAKDGKVIFIHSVVLERYPAYLLDFDGNVIWTGSHDLRNAIGISPSGNYFIPSADPEVIIYRVYSTEVDTDQ
jgi:outer membrane protein assembly factor BamB